MELAPFYSYATVAQLERKTVATITGWISDDRKLPETERRFPGAGEGLIPLAAIKARYGLTNDEIKALDLPAPVAPRPRRAPRPARTAPA